MDPEVFNGPWGYYGCVLIVLVSGGWRVMMVVVSDVHLGYTSQKEAFLAFLEYLGAQPVERLVIVGDLLDMWRRDIAGVIIENLDVFGQLDALQQQGVTIDIVAGNHDYHLQELRDRYQFAFHPSGVQLPLGARTYTFYHGYEFDAFQLWYWFEWLCLSTDEGGQQFEAFWRRLRMIAGFWRSLVNVFRKRQSRRIYTQIFRPPEQRLEYEVVRQAALTEQVEQGIAYLIYGHTHEPFLSTTGTIANTGSWVPPDPAKCPHYNTFLEISKQEIELKTWRDRQATLISETFTPGQLTTQPVLY